MTYVSLVGPRYPFQQGALLFGRQRPIQRAGFYRQPKSDNPPNRFVVIGDSGSGEGFRHGIGRLLERLYASKPFQTLLLLGDNVYGTAGEGRHPMDGDPTLFKDRIKAAFKGLIRKGVQCFPILGNHDVRYGKEEQQLAYWNVPRYYQFSRGNVDFFALDTTVFLPGYDKCYSERMAFAQEKTKEQLNWLDQQLTKSKAKYKVVMGHYPMYCSGEYINRGRNAELMRAVLNPILMKHQVDAYLCGHEHYYERSKPLYGLTQFLSGSSSKVAHDVAYMDAPPYQRASAALEKQFMVFEETDKGLAFQVINSDERVIDEGVLPPKDRKPVEDKAPTPLYLLTAVTKFLHVDAS